MSKNIKFYLLVGPVLVSFIFAMTSPTIQIYFMRLVSQEVLAIANMLTVGLAAIVNTTITNDRAKDIYRRNFTLIVVVDVICFTAVTYGGLLDITIRFLGLAVINAVSTTLWCKVMRNAINRIINGDKLTDWDAFENSLELYGSLLGGLIAICSFDISVETCLALQCISNAIMGATDLHVYTKLDKLYKKNGGNKIDD